MNNIGLLLPRSVIYPSINFDILEGLRCSLAAAGANDVQVTTENIAHGENDNVIYAHCEKMLMNGIMVIAGYVNPATTIKLQPLFENAGGVFIALDAGYQFAFERKHCPNIFTVSLGGALACRLIARNATLEENNHFSFVSSFYDAGFRTAYTFFNSLGENGGEISFNHITQLKRADFTLEPLRQHLQTSPGDSIFVSFCGDMTEDLFNALRADAAFARHAFYGAPFVAEETWLAKINYPGMNIKTCVPWARQLSNLANNEFINALAAKKREANVFSLLGWEAGILVAKVIESGSFSVLEGFEFASPRGAVKIDAARHIVVAPMYVAQIVKDEATGKCCLLPGPELLDQKELDKFEQEKDAFPGGTVWQNAYACLNS
jgi:branched-chain amino acid transport system substrate-binding protein